MAEPIETLPHRYTEGDTLPELGGFLSNTDLTGYTVTLNMDRPDGTVLSRPATLTDPANGLFKIDWAATDLIAGTCQLTTLRFTSPSGEVETERFYVDVARKLL